MEQPVEIIVRTNGSLRINGNFELKDAEGNMFDLSGRSSIALCRCGHSKDKPFCDGSHKEVGFQSIVKVRVVPSSPAK